MGKGRIETGKAPQIFVGACDGDLVIRGGAELALLVRGEYTAEEKAGAYHLTGRGDLRLVVPSGATVSVEEVSGKLIVKGVAGACQVGRVYGDAVLTVGGPTHIDAVHGDLSARNVGALAVGAVHGDADARRAGGLALSTVYGDLVARQIAGPVTVEEISGNVDIRGVDGNVCLLYTSGSPAQETPRWQRRVGSCPIGSRHRSCLSRLSPPHSAAARRFQQTT